MTNEMFPGFFGMLPTSATGPQECILLMALDFRSQLFEGMARIPTYSSWLLACDMEPAYRYHRRVLQLLQWRCPPERWWLKTPAHMHSIAALDRIYPDARFVMTHRDVGKVLPSVCALFEALSNVLTEHPDPVGHRDPQRSALVLLAAAPDGVSGQRERRSFLRCLVPGGAARSDGRGGTALRGARRRAQRRCQATHAGLLGRELEGPLRTPHLQERDIRARSGRPYESSSRSTTTGSMCPSRSRAGDRGCPARVASRAHRVEVD